MHTLGKQLPIHFQVHGWGQGANSYKVDQGQRKGPGCEVGQLGHEVSTEGSGVYGRCYVPVIV